MLVASWLIAGENPAGSSMNQMMSSISDAHQLPNFIHPVSAPPALDLNLPTVSFYYGNDGKRQAVELFLMDVCACDPVPPLLLYSSEEFDWLYEDPAFSRRWAALLIQYISRGGTIKMIHTINRNSSEMLIALQKWVPLYMSGAITPYYYPKLRDRVSRRTLFIAQGHAAITANSIRQNTDGALNALICDKAAVQALELEFSHYLALCRPLMNIFTVQERASFCENLHAFEADETALITAAPVPSLASMSLETAQHLAKRGGDWVLSRWESCMQSFKQQQARGQTITEILNLPDPELVKSGKFPIPMGDLFSGSALFYTASEFAAHLRSTLALLRENKQYQVLLSRGIPANILVYAKDDLGAMIVKLSTPSIAFAITEQRLSAAFWAYLLNIVETQKKRLHTIQVLEQYIAELEKT